ncbi:MAG: hypothetical protein IPF54_24735 [Draconibacterium sp.]|nr:hypothetical protein [Draconibacterium sp.]
MGTSRTYWWRPFGAMIPGAMVAICLGLLLKCHALQFPYLPFWGYWNRVGWRNDIRTNAWIFKKPRNCLVGTAGTTIKGAVWGMLGGAVLSLGFFLNRIQKKTLILAFLLMMAGMIAGFKLINDPMVLIFLIPQSPF